MREGREASGPAGTVRVGYQRAARIVGWTITPAGRGRVRLGAALADVDRFWIRERPVSVELDAGPIHWRWDPVEEFAVEERRLTAVLVGPPAVTRVRAGH